MDGTHAHEPAVKPAAGRPLPLMPEVAIITTLALIAAPILLVAGTLAAAAAKRIARRGSGDGTEGHG